ncbi:MAG: chlorite dismutase family protein, partial [Candidatus Nanohaloarchaea archaeon]
MVRIAAEGYFVLHDFRRIDWDAWRSSPAQRREAAIDSGRTFLQDRAPLEEGETAVFTIAGHKADLLLLHLRPTLDGVEQAERAFEATNFAEYTEQSSSFVSVTEIGGYTSPAYFEDPESVDPGIRRYMETKRYPEVPQDVYVSFYPMSKRRQPDANWYGLPLEERAEMMREHGETGKDYAGTVTQVVSSALGLDDWEWGVTLFA